MEHEKKSDLIEDICNIESVIKKTPNKKSRVIEMMSKIVSEFKKEVSLNKSFKRSKSPQCREDSFAQVKKSATSHSQQNLNNKEKSIKKLQIANEYLSLKGFKAVQVAHTRPISAFDLQNRLRPTTRALTAKTTKTQTRSIERGSSSRSIISARKHTKGMSFNPQDY